MRQVTQTDLDRAKLKVKLKPFIKKVKETHGMAFRLPDSLIDSISDSDIPVALKILNDSGLIKINGFWEVN